MKNNKAFYTTLLLVVICFGALMYTSCVKDRCSGVYCQNGGSCSNGNCICPVGYIGKYCQNLATTQIDFYNNTFTTVYMSSGGTTYNIPSNTSLSFTSNYGDYISASAYTQGSTGFVYNWNNISVDFPSSGTNYFNFDIDGNYFYLEVNNNDAYNISQIITNYNSSNQLTENINIPSGYGYSGGYYIANSNTQIKFIFSNSLYTNPAYLSFLSNTQNGLNLYASVNVQ